MAVAHTPELSVVVASHDRPLRLRWLLNALQEQTLDRALWEVVVCHDSAGAETDELLETHPLAQGGTLRHTRLPSGSAPPGANRNAAVRLASARTIVFTDDDCRPPPEWLANVRAAVARNPGAIIQGPVRGDPDEEIMRLAAFWRTLYIPTVPGAWAECANIVYPRELFERIGGFVEDVFTGEDIELNIRAREAGAAYVGDEAMQSYHAVYDAGLLGYVRGVGRWGDLALLFKHHPELRERLTLGIFWKRTHALLPPALIGLALGRRNARWALLAIPWAVQWEPRHGGPKGRIRHLAELPGWALIDLSEIIALGRGSIRHRSVLL
jgi:glycosyltransferase involved in cell wall biosynthesis